MIQTSGKTIFEFNAKNPDGSFSRTVKHFENGLFINLSNVICAYHSDGDRCLKLFTITDDVIRIYSDDDIKTIEEKFNKFNH